MADRTEYAISLVLNGRHFRRVVIDPHYRVKHSDLTDEIILNLVRQLAGEDFRIVSRKNGFEYFRVEPVFFRAKPYRLVLVTHEGDNFVGVINAFRVRKKK